MKKILSGVFFSLLLLPFLSLKEADTSKFEIYKIDLNRQHIEMFWKDDQGVRLGSFQKLKDYLAAKNRKLVFAMNGGMYHADGSPVGLYIEEGKQLHKLNISSGGGNFNMKPNGVFYITSDNKAGVRRTEKFENRNMKYATQSGPMLVIDGKIHDAFSPTSTNLHIRNGVGVASSSEIYFVISKEKVSFYELASLFKEHLKCNNAPYLDGYVSRMYLPSGKWDSLDGDFGVMIGEWE